MFHSLLDLNNLVVDYITYCVLSFLMWLIHKDLTHMICSIDTQKWIDATQEISQNTCKCNRVWPIAIVALSPALIWNGDIPIDALQSVSRLAWVISVASFVGLLHYRLGRLEVFGGLIYLHRVMHNLHLRWMLNFAQYVLSLSLVWMNLFPMYPRIFFRLLGTLLLCFE